jgi:uncharacterized RDD family membrane protein YckC/uncharacterized membrane protein SpoIIM required for sporulation
LPSATDFRQHVEVETPEHVVLDYEVAGVGSRTLAALVDWAIIAAMGITVALVAGVMHKLGSWVTLLAIVMFFVLTFGYFALFEGFNDGQTPGKRGAGIRVIRDTGHGVTFGDAAVRNLLLWIDLIGLIGLILIAFDRQARRLGDLVAGTLVVRDHPVEAATFTQAAATPALGDRDGSAPQLADDDFHLLHEFVGRAMALPEPVRQRFAHDFATRFAEHGRPVLDDYQFVVALHRTESERRSGRFGAVADARTPAAHSVAERLVARKQARWRAFQLLAERVDRDGLDALSAAELPDFAARYREVAADLSRARTYHADDRVTLALERLVAAGHNALYRAHRHTAQRAWLFISRECPAAVIGARYYVALAIAVLVVPALGGYALLRTHPTLAPQLLPAVMLERADAGAAREAQGLGYVEEKPANRPVLAAAIIVNNVHVAFNCFASGIVLGVGSLVALAYNGLLLGAISGYFADRHLSGYLWTFVIGHSVLELFAICVSGAAGFLLGRAVIAPGDLPRRDALVLAGRRAIRMIGAVVVLLLVAGTIEGLISSSASTVAVRLTVSGASLCFLVAYLANGRRRPLVERP